ncbi:MAG: hypothetical protein WA810_13100 [Maribacter sp.]
MIKQLLKLRGYIDVAEPKVTEGAKIRLQDLLSQWSTFKKEHDAILIKKWKTIIQRLQVLASRH